MRRTMVLALLLGALTPPAASGKADELWATVNFCDTPHHPNALGVRASMPGIPRGSTLLVRFRAQYQAGGEWSYVAGADSGWRRLGRARGRAVDSGWSFEFAPPSAPVTFRGVVRFRWRRDGRIVRRALEITETGHRSATGADPEGYSAATCSMA